MCQSSCKKQWDSGTQTKRETWDFQGNNGDIDENKLKKEKIIRAK